MINQTKIDVMKSSVQSKIDQSGMGFKSGFCSVFDDVEVIQKRFSRMYAILSKETSYYDDFWSVGDSLYRSIEKFQIKK